MTNRIRTTATALLAALAIAAAGATTATAIPYDPDGSGGGYESPTAGTPSAANTYTCTHWSGGVCVQRRCTASGGNNCQTFSQNCAGQGHTYNGSSQTGTCSRQNLA